MSAIERIRRCVAELPEGPARDDAERRLDSVVAVADPMLACAPTPSPIAIRQARSTDWNADRSAWKREEQAWIAARSASTASIVDAHAPGPRPGIPSSSDTESSGDPGASDEVRNVSADTFDPAEALQNLHGQAIQLEALTHAASEAVTQLPFPSDREDRRIFDRVYALVSKVADETEALVRYGDELIAALAEYLKRRRSDADEHPGKRS